MKQIWKIKQLGEVCNIIGGGTPSKKVDEYYDGDILWATVRDMNEDILYTTEHKITQIGLDNSSSNIIPKDNVIIATRVGLGKVCFLINDTAINQDLKGIIPKNTVEIVSLFLFWWFKNISEQIVKMGTGATVQGVKIPFIESLQFPIPPLEEQKHIVVKLDECFAVIDKARVNVEKNLNNAKELFQSQLNEIFSQKGDGWVDKILDEIGEIQTGTTPSTKDKSNYGDFIPFVKPPHFKPDGSIDAGNSMLSESGLKIGRLFPPNSVLMVCIGATIGKTGFTETAVSSNQQINCLTPNENYYPKLLYYGLISPFVQKQVADIGRGAQATLPIINKTKWQGLSINIPESKSEQNKIVKQLDDLKSQTQSLESNYQQELEALDELKKSILQKAFRGELTIDNG